MATHWPEVVEAGEVLNCSSSHELVSIGDFGGVGTKRKKGEAGGPAMLSFNELKARKKRLIFGKSAIHSWGLYAAEPIEKEEFVTEYLSVGRPVLIRSMDSNLDVAHLGAVLGAQHASIQRPDGKSDLRAVARAHHGCSDKRANV